MQAERAKCHLYDPKTKQWNTTEATIRLNTCLPPCDPPVRVRILTLDPCRRPCGEGGMRIVIRLDVLGEDGSVERRCVAKVSLVVVQRVLNR